MEPTLLSLGFSSGGGGGVDLLGPVSALSGFHLRLEAAMYSQSLTCGRGRALGANSAVTDLNAGGGGGGCRGGKGAEAEFLDERRKPDKILIVFLLAIYSRLYNFALRFLFLQTHASS